MKGMTPEAKEKRREGKGRLPRRRMHEPRARTWPGEGGREGEGGVLGECGRPFRFLAGGVSSVAARAFANSLTRSRGGRGFLAAVAAAAAAAAANCRASALSAGESLTLRRGTAGGRAGGPARRINGRAE